LKEVSKETFFRGKRDLLYAEVKRRFGGFAVATPSGASGGKGIYIYTYIYTCVSYREEDTCVL